MFRPSLFLLATLSSLAGVSHAKTDWTMVTPFPDVNLAIMIFTVLAIVVTIVQCLHCISAASEVVVGRGKHLFVVLLPGLVSLLALYILRAYFLTHYHPTTHLSRAVYAMLYFTEQFATVTIAASTMALLHYTERDWYETTIGLQIRKGLRTLLIATWLALVIAQTVMYRPPSDVDHNALLTIALYQDRLTHAIIGIYNFFSLDIAISSLLLWIHVREREYKDPESGPEERFSEFPEPEFEPENSVSEFVDPESGSDHHTGESPAREHERETRHKFLLFAAVLLAIRALALLVVHIISIASIPAHLVTAIWNVILFGWLVLDPTLCYAAVYALLRASRVPAPLQFRWIVVACAAVAAAAAVAAVALVGACLKGMAEGERDTYVVKDKTTGNKHKIVVQKRWY
ncbi:hypothetical protein B0H16DRAFT_1888085 [Mycena metata]|uniref:Uncharacterized protein n=1 Tax=Mycena metata TaxID=1033252 RepID=A0AAD7N903_9AGAR|nr:hypothetical protein B0H16DRAFT_1598936 [Mycena metata]KAJ7749688.1 hypothetical protein B0H16DRAFT_1888085 [Mycena metata]